MNKTKSIFAFLAFVALALAGPAAAQDDRGIYLGGSYGYAWHKDACKNLVIPCGSTDPAWRVFGGYQFNRTWAAELGYANLGEVEGEGNVGGLDARLLRRVKSFDLVGLGYVPIAGNLSAFGKLGVYRGRVNVDVTIGGVPEHAGTTNAGWSYGLGLEYKLWRLALRGEWQRWENIGGHSTGEDDVDALLVGLLFRF